jgi:hypothetical protein
MKNEVIIGRIVDCIEKILRYMKDVYGKLSRAICPLYYSN